MQHHIQHKGITILITLVLVGVLLGVSAALMSVTLKQFQLSNIVYDSEVAFQAANAGMECALMRDFVIPVDPGGSEMRSFDIPAAGPRLRVGETGAMFQSVTCMGVTSPDLGSGNNVQYQGSGINADEQLFEFTWGSQPTVCSQISVYKFFDSSADIPLMVNGVDMRPGDPCDEDATCTVIQSRGYNVPCNEISTSQSAVEREYTLIY